MELFDKKFIYLEWDDKLEGKEAFLADSLPELRRRVEQDDPNFRYIVKKREGDYPFGGSVCYAMAYYDPNYICKWAYYTQGKVIQFRGDEHDEWKDFVGEPLWSDACEYRVKPIIPEEPKDYSEKSENKRTRRMTNRELAKWLAQGNGQVRHRDSNYVTPNINAYVMRDEDKECPDYLVIRDWNEGEWHEPEIWE